LVSLEGLDSGGLTGP